MAVATFQQFTVNDGLISNLLDVSFAKLANGNIIMASGMHISVFSPDIVMHEKEKVPLLLTDVMAGDQQKTFPGNEANFNWDEKNISLHWGLLNFSNPLANTYYYKLDGVNNEWQSAGNKGIASFNTLAPGKYVFHYKAASSDGKMSDEQLVVLIIHPPFWATWWFRVLMFIAAATIFYFIVRYISQRKLKEKVTILERQKAVEKERNRISRDMHDELGSGLTKIAILSEVVKSQGAAADTNIEKISSTARTLVDNLDEMVWALNPKNDTLDNLAAYMSEHACQYLEGTGIHCVIDLPENIQPLYISEDKRRNIFMVLKEFLNNTVKHSGASHFYLTLTQENNSFGIVLKDDGKGFNIALLSQNGNGLKNMQQRIADAGGECRLSNGFGTSFTITFNHS